MAKLSITTAWNETAGFVQREARLLFPLSFMLIALPVALMEAIRPPAAPGRLPEAGAWMIVAAVALLASLVGNLALTRLALKAGASVAEALRHALGRLLPMLGAVLLLIAAGIALVMAVAFVIILIVTGGAPPANSGVPNEAMQRASLLMLVLVAPILVYCSARLLPMPPVAVAEPGGPFTLISRSWRLTRGHGLKLVGFILLAGILMGVLRMAIESVLGSLFILAAGPAEPGSVSALLIIAVLAAVNTLLAVYLAALVARIYAQLAA